MFADAALNGAIRDNERDIEHWKHNPTTADLRPFFRDDTSIELPGGCLVRTRTCNPGSSTVIASVPGGFALEPRPGCDGMHAKTSWSVAGSSPGSPSQRPPQARRRR